EDDQRERDAGLAQVVAEWSVVRAALLERHDDDEQQWQCGRSANSYVGALLGDELPHLPAVSGRGRRSHAAVASTGRSASDPSVSSKKRLSSVACSGTSAAMPRPAAVSLRESSITERSSAANTIASRSRAVSPIPNASAQMASASSLLVVRR